MKRLFTLLSTLLLICGAGWLPVRAQALDPGFQATALKAPYQGGLQTGVQLLAVQPDGKILVAGGFDFANGTLTGKIARLNPDGTTDAAFNPGGVGANGFIGAMALQPDGKIVVVGGFTAYNGTPVLAQARLNANGTLDPSFAGLAPTSAVRQLNTLALQPDGKLLVGGGLSFTPGQANALVRLNPDGTPDASFTTSPGVAGDFVRSLLVQADGKILVGGTFFTPGGQLYGLVRLNANGSADGTFGIGTGANFTVSGLAQQPDGKLLVAGSFTQINGQPAPGVARLLLDGTFDNSFTPGTGVTTATGTPSSVRSLVLLGNGNILLGGSFQQYNGVARGRVARLLPDGTLDAGFAAGSTGANNTVLALAELPGGQVLAGGFLTDFDGTAKTGLARLTVAGADDAAFAPLVERRGTLSVAVPLPTGQVLVQGTFTTYNGAALPGPASLVRRLNANGTLDAAYASPFAGGLYGARPDGSFYSFTIVGNQFQLQRALPSGANDNAFVNLPFGSTSTGGFAVPQGVTVQPDGRLLVFGNFTTYGGATRTGIARLNADGTLDASFTPPGSTVQRTVTNAVVQASGKVVLTYRELGNGAVSGSPLIRLNANGTPDNTFAPGGGAGLNALVTVLPQPDGKLLINGGFSSFNGQPTPYGNVRVDADGATDNTFNGLTSSYTFRTVQPNGRILATTSYLGTPASALVRLNANGSPDNTFAPVTIPQPIFLGDDGVAGVVLQPTDGKIIVYGALRTVAGQVRFGLARLTNVGLATRAAAVALPLEVYPNPASQRLTVLLPASTASLQATLLDLTGRAVRRWALPAHQPEAGLDVSTVAPGVYVLRIPAAAGVYQQKVVVTH